MCGSLHLLSNKVLSGTTSLPISYNGILIDARLKNTTATAVPGMVAVIVGVIKKADGFVCLHV